MKIFYRCCVPHCGTYGSATMFMQFPLDCEKRKAWVNAIPRKNWVIDHNTLICSQHFIPDDIVKNTSSVQVKPNAVPSIFPEAKTEDKMELYQEISRLMFEIPNRDFVPETFGDLERLPNYDDFILDFQLLLGKYKQRLKTEIQDGGWLVQETANFLLFYQLDVSSALDGIEVICNIKIDAFLKVSIGLGGIIIDPLDLTRFLPISSKITRWSQVQHMLTEFGKHEGIPDTGMSNFVIIDPKTIINVSETL